MFIYNLYIGVMLYIIYILTGVRSEHPRPSCSAWNITRETRSIYLTPYESYGCTFLSQGVMGMAGPQWSKGYQANIFNPVRIIWVHVLSQGVMGMAGPQWSKGYQVNIFNTMQHIWGHDLSQGVENWPSEGCNGARDTRPMCLPPYKTQGVRCLGAAGASKGYQVNRFNTIHTTQGGARFKPGRGSLARHRCCSKMQAPAPFPWPEQLSSK